MVHQDYLSVLRGPPRIVIKVNITSRNTNNAVILSCWTSKTCWTRCKNLVTEPRVSCKLVFGPSNRLGGSNDKLRFLLCAKKEETHGGTEMTWVTRVRYLGQWILNWHLTMKKHLVSIEMLTPTYPSLDQLHQNIAKNGMNLTFSLTWSLLAHI